jgi:hypothetical protein
MIALGGQYKFTALTSGYQEKKAQAGIYLLSFVFISYILFLGPSDLLVPFLLPSSS